jgi:hypothetical protein
VQERRCVFGGEPLRDTLFGAIACEIGLILCYGGLACANVIPLLPAEAGWREPVGFVLLALFIGGMLLGIICVGLGLMAWILGAKLPLFLPVLAWGVVNRDLFREDLRDDFTRSLWRWHLYLLPPVLILAATVMVLGW